MNPWHDIDPGSRAPELVDCIIEVPRGSRNKYELDKKTGLLRLDRVLYSAVFYPANYGFIPRTFSDDSDPLDILVLGQEPVAPLCIVTARPIGVMQMVDENEEDDKIIAIHEHDPAFTHYRDISHLPEHSLNELQRFFEDYKALELKKVRIERFLGRIDAHNVIERSMRLYEDTFVSTSEVGVEATARPSPEAKAREERTGTLRTPSRSVRVGAARRAAAHLEDREHGNEAPRTEKSANDEKDAAAEGEDVPDFIFPSHDLDELRDVETTLDDHTESDTIEPIAIDDHTLDALTLQPQFTEDEAPTGTPAAPPE